ncbi:MAG: hypothetical protein K2J40_02650 [Ruminococcus sp.]|nr:hypothetical protein [Ruminococcus sp.]
MKKIPLNTIIFFYLALIPAIAFLLFCIFYGDIYEIFGALVWECGARLVFLIPVVLWLQAAAIINYIDARKKVHTHSMESMDNDE